MRKPNLKPAAIIYYFTLFTLFILHYVSFTTPIYT